jgi:hypothetical protein
MLCCQEGMLSCLTLNQATRTFVISGVPRNFFGGWGVHQIQLRTEGRENRDLGAVAPLSGVPLNLQMSETRILIRLLRMYFPRNWEFGSALSKLRNFVGGGGVNQSKPPSVSHCLSLSIERNDFNYKSCK